jgi:NAD(P)H-dependent FMN reductase
MAYLISIILGTARKEAISEKIAEFVFESAKNYGFEVELIKPRNWLDSPFTEEMNEEKRNKLSEIFTRSNGFIIVSPEYNHSFPGELKLLLDNFYEEFKHKPVGICGVSSGKLGGARVVEQLRLVCIELSMIPLRNAVYFSNVKNFEEEKEGYQEFLKILFDELKFYCEKLGQN